jgi:ubiquinone/menaquinone biosynthesis C-methylase UbiE
MNQFAFGCRMSLKEWMDLNRNQIFTNPDLKRYVSPFPPVELMANVSGLQNEQDFAAHGTDIYRALTTASSKPLSEYASILDFGCGCGRLARMFKGHSGRIAGCDIDARHVDWINKNLDFMEAKLSRVNPPIPYKDNEFEAVISISIFTHLTEKSQDQFLSELYRVCMPEGRLFLTVHGKRALERALNEPTILAMLAMDPHRFERAQQEFSENRHAFVLQFGHLTTKHENASEQERLKDNQSGFKKMAEEPFEYGITFVPEDYLRSHWGKWFDIVAYHHGGIHDFQDIVALKPK